MALISVIVPVFNEEENIPAFCRRLENISGKSGHDFEFIFVDDGSSDKSFSLLNELSTKDNRIRVIKFSRNFGSHAACLAGLMNASGDASAFISADLQEPPELILGLMKQWDNGHKVVIGMREGSESSGGFFQKIYYFLVQKYALKNMPARGTDVFLIDRAVVNVITDMREKNTSVFGLILWSGFQQVFVPYKREARQKGVSKWSMGKKIKLFIDTFVSFSYFPIRLMSLMGTVMLLAGFLYAIAIIINRVLLLQGVEGWSYLMAVVLIVSGIQLLMIGIMGEYVWRNFEESRNRPVFIVEKLVGFNPDK